MAKELLCHIGLFKGGSSFLQNVLHALNPTLYSIGIDIWSATTIPRVPFIAPEIYQQVQAHYQARGMFGFEYQGLLCPELHHQPVNAFALSEYLSLFADDPSCQKYNQCLHDALGQGSIDKVILSHEDFTCGGCRHADTPAQLVQFRDKCLHHLQQLLQDFNVTIILVVRRQDHLLQSMYNSTVLCHFVTASLDEIADFFGAIVCYDTLLDTLVDLFGEKQVKIIFFEDLKENPRQFTETFMKTIIPDFQVRATSVLPPVNQSLSPDAFRIMVHANRILRSKYGIEDQLVPRRIPAEADHERALLQEALAKFTATEHDTHDYLWSESQREEILDRFRQGNRKLFDHHIPRDCENQKWRSCYIDGAAT